MSHTYLPHFTYLTPMTVNADTSHQNSRHVRKPRHKATIYSFLQPWCQKETYVKFKRETDLGQEDNCNTGGKGAPEETGEQEGRNERKG